MVGVCLGITLIFGFAAGFDVGVRCGAFLFAGLIPLVTGSVLIYRNFWWRPWVGMLLMALLLGLIAFEIALMGILSNLGSLNLNWIEVLKQAGTVGLVVFVILIVFSPVLVALWKGMQE